MPHACRAPGEDVTFFAAGHSGSPNTVDRNSLPPQGNEVSASAGLLDVPISEREVLTTYPEAGTWTVGVVGRVNTVTSYTGEVQTYVDTSARGRSER